MKLCSCSSPLYIQYLIPLPKKLAVKEKKTKKLFSRIMCFWGKQQRLHRQPQVRKVADQMVKKKEKDIKE